MLEPRIYRTGFVAVAVAVIVFAFSLDDQQGPLSGSLAPDAFSGQDAYALTTRLAAEYPVRRPGSAGDDALAGEVAQTLGRDGFAVSTGTSTMRTADGKRTLETVVGTRPGLSSGSIVIVAHRDSLSSPATSQLSGTATLLALAKVLSGETHRRTIVLASTSGSAGAAGAAALARSLNGVDAVIALGDLGAAHLRPPLIVPWSGTAAVAPPELRNTISASLASQTGLAPGGTSLAGQLAHLAFPLTLGEQGPFGARDIPAVLLSATGEREGDPRAAVNAARITAFGRTVLESISALDGGPGVSRASPYLLYQRKVIPAWAIALLALSLILPVLGTVIDGLARARRRGQSVGSWLGWVLAGALPFVLGALIVLGVRLSGLLVTAPSEPLGAGAVPLRAGGIALLIALACVLALSFWGLGYVRPKEAGEGRGLATLLVMCTGALAVWFTNPFAALLLVPALHLWMWVVDPQARLSRASALALLVVGLAPPMLIVVYYAVTLGLGPSEALWNGLLLIAGGHITLIAVLEWCVLLGCAARVLSIAVRGGNELDEGEQAVTIRGPLNYAGPGSLGGTESALRR